MTSFPPILDAWYLTGPTASGKSDVGVALARQIHAEIISLDSMAVYRGMDIGTAKPSMAERQGVPHHLIDLVDPTAEFSVAEFLTAAHQCAAEIRSRGREVLLVGGTPLYLKAMLRGLSGGPKADWDLREQLEKEAAANGLEALHQRLAQIDPDAAAKIHPQDTRRLIRAFEVYQQTGQPISQYQEHFDRGHPAEECRVFVLNWPRPELHRRINQRVVAMYEEGLVLEVQQLLEKYGHPGRTAAQAAGYREVIEHLRGECDLPAAVERTQARTRQLARRQMTWFRSLSECTWIDLCEPVDPTRVASEIVEKAGIRQGRQGRQGPA